MVAEKGSSKAGAPVHHLDVRGHNCPIPVLKTRKHLATLAGGVFLRVQTDDPAARIDMAHFCAEAGHDLVDTAEEDHGLVFLIRKKGV